MTCSPQLGPFRGERLALVAMEEPPSGDDPEGGSSSLRWWRPTQGIQTAAGMPLKVALAETEARPICQKLARKVLHLGELGSSYRAIARKLDVDEKTVARAIRWLQMIQDQ